MDVVDSETTCPNTITVSVFVSITIPAFFIEALLNSKGILHATISVLMLIFLPPSIQGITARSIEGIRLPSPNLKKEVDFSFTTFFFSISLRVSKNNSNHLTPHTVLEQPRSNIIAPIVSPNNTSTLSSNPLSDAINVI
ncbi:unnamed protein product [Meganyctiphanes norvegica]|uniref:Uncharacterized protein n=1 Tax=Meganyctiphanes norvegica TaxID=48144 RepID=A0AAV2SGI7_MEGNR